MLAQEGEGKVEYAVYYLSKKLLQYEANYSLVEKTCLAVIWATKKLRHYFQSYRVHAISKHDPLKYLQQTPSLTGKLAKQLVLLTEFDIDYMAKKVVKGRTITDFLAQNPLADKKNGSQSSLMSIQGQYKFNDGKCTLKEQSIIKEQALI